MKLKLLLLLAVPSAGAMHQSTQQPFRAAGVLPYAYDHATGKIKVLVDASSIHRNELSDFGGLRDDGEYHPQITAAREACEELMFLFDTDQNFSKFLSLPKPEQEKQVAQSMTHRIIRIALELQTCFPVECDNYIMHWMPVTYNPELPQRFLERKRRYQDTAPAHLNETSEIMWVDLEKMYASIDANGSNISKAVTISGHTLYYPFVQSLRIGRLLDITRRIDAQLNPAKNFLHRMLKSSDAHTWNARQHLLFNYGSYSVINAAKMIRTNRSHLFVSPESRSGKSIAQ